MVRLIFLNDTISCRSTGIVLPTKYLYELKYFYVIFSAIRITQLLLAPCQPIILKFVNQILWPSIVLKLS